MADTLAPVPVDAWESAYVSRYGQVTVGGQIYRAGQPADADSGMNVEMRRYADQVVVADREATRADVGTYEFTTTSAETDTPGFYRLTWTYSIDGQAQSFVTWIEVGQASPAYDALNDDARAVVDRVWLKFADLFDSPYGGPNLQVYYQTRFGRGRIAQLLQTAIDTLNTISQPHQAYALDQRNGKPFPYAQWAGLLEQATYIEVVKHLRRSYLEQPDAQGVNLARQDRAIYFNRWGEILAEEISQFERKLSGYKIAAMNLGSPHVIVSGGVFGEYAPTRQVGSWVTRPRYWARWY